MITVLFIPDPRHEKVTTVFFNSKPPPLKEDDCPFYSRPSVLKDDDRSFKYGPPVSFPDSRVVQGKPLLFSCRDMADNPLKAVFSTEQPQRSE
nr:hypothetical protein [Candidatus Electrothrix aestuarii]